MLRKCFGMFLTLSFGMVLTPFVMADQAETINMKFQNAPAGKSNVVGNIDGKPITYDQVFKPIENEIYDAQFKVFEVKQMALQNMALEIYMNKDPRKKGMSNDDFLSKVLMANKAVSAAEIDAFIVEKQIPKAQINDDLKSRVQQHLMNELRRDVIQHYLAEQSKKSPIIYHFEEPKAPFRDIKVAHSPTMGPANAKVTIVEFSDFQCPYCAMASKIIHDLQIKYKDKVKVVFKNYPLPFHKDAKVASVAGMCAENMKKGSFWKMHDQFFANQEKLALNDIVAMGVGVGLKKEDFEKCITNNKYLNLVEADIALGNSIGIEHTPTFFINGKLFSKKVQLERMHEYIDRELK